MPVIASVEPMVMTAVVDAMEMMYGQSVSVNANWSFTSGGYPSFDVQSVRLASPHPIYAGSNTRVSLVMQGGGQSVSEPIELDVSVTVPVIVMNQPVAPGSLIQADAVRVTRVSVNSAPANAVRGIAGIVGRKARSRLFAGRMVTQPMLYDANSVVAGQPVRIMVESGSIQIATEGVVRTGAGIGESVSVELDNGTMLEAEVRDDQTVVVWN
ncbi:flagella basal body P-ring formation protein FlgA [bacterium]|nr:flagella basal body P-ring formation protein FlgA [bacterium]